MPQQRSTPRWSELDRAVILFCALLSALAMALAVASGRPESAARGFVEYYACALVCAVLGALAFFEARARGKKKGGASIDRHEGLLWLGVFLFALIYRLGFVRQGPYGMDEDLQLLTAVRYYPVSAGALQHQPPLELAIMFLFQQVLGVTEISGRMSSMIFSSVAVATLALLGRRLWGGWALPLLAAGVFTLHSVAAQFAWEARPISLGFASTGLVLCSVLRWQRNEGASDLRSWAYGAAAAVFSLLGLGLQPPFFLFSLSCVTLLWISRPLKERIWLVSQFVVAVLVFLPIQVRILQTAPPRFQKLAASSGIRSNPFQWKLFAPLFDLYFRPLLFPALLSLAALGILFLMRSRVRMNRPRLAEPSFFIGAAVVFVLSLVPFFSASIQYDLHDYYVALVWQPLVLGVFGILAELAARIGPVGRVPPALLIPALAILIAVLDRGGREHFARFHRRFTDFRAASHEVLRRLPSGNIALFNFCLGTPACSCSWGLTGAQRYFGGRGHERVNYPKDYTSPWVRNFFLYDENSRAVALLVESSCSSVEPASLGRLVSRHPNWTLEQRPDVSLLFSQGPHIKEGLLTLFESLAEDLAAKGKSRWGILPELIFANLWSGNYRRSFSYLAELGWEYGDYLRRSFDTRSNHAGVEVESVVQLAAEGFCGRDVASFCSGIQEEQRVLSCLKQSAVSKECAGAIRILECISSSPAEALSRCDGNRPARPGPWKPSRRTSDPE